MATHPTSKVDTLFHIRITKPVISHQDGAVIIDIDAMHLTPGTEQPTSDISLSSFHIISLNVRSMQSMTASLPLGAR